MNTLVLLHVVLAQILGQGIRRATSYAGPQTFFPLARRKYPWVLLFVLPTPLSRDYVRFAPLDLIIGHPRIEVLHQTVTTREFGKTSLSTSRQPSMPTDDRRVVAHLPMTLKILFNINITSYAELPLGIRHLTTRTRLENDHPYRRGVKSVDRVVGLGAIGYHRQDVHLGPQVHEVSGFRESLD